MHILHNTWDGDIDKDSFDANITYKGSWIATYNFIGFLRE